MSLMNVRLKLLYSVIIFVFILLLTCILILTLYAQHTRNLLEKSEIFRKTALSIAHELETSSEDLTRMARFYAATVYLNPYIK